MQTLFSYSLQDLMLFSPETWQVLYQEYFARYWWLSAVVCFFVLLTFVWSIYSARDKNRTVLADITVFGSGIAFYEVFYVQINPYASVFSSLMLLQLVLCLLPFFRRRHNTDNGWSLFVEKRGFSINSVLSYSSLLLTLLGCALIYLQSSMSIPLAPGAHPLPGLLLLMFLWKIKGGYRRYLFCVPVVLVLSEIATLYLLDIAFWWLFLVATLFILIPNTGRSKL